MSYKLAVASGKGGTGKTSVSVSLYRYLSNAFEGKVKLVDCDVEEPNDVIFFKKSEKISEAEVSQLVPFIDLEKCTFCRKCSEYCEFNAIVVIPPAGFAEVNRSLCHSCGACLEACNESAITEHPEEIGRVSFYQTKTVDLLIEGKLKIGSAMQTMLIKELKKKVSPDNEIVIFDAPPGTSCPVVETISDANYVVLVAEPTLFGLHDLKLMVKLIKELHIKFGVIINKAGLGSEEIYDFLENEDIQLLGEIPFSKEYAALYAKGDIIETIPLHIEKGYQEIIRNIFRKINNAV